MLVAVEVDVAEEAPAGADHVGQRAPGRGEVGGVARDGVGAGQGQGGLAGVVLRLLVARAGGVAIVEVHELAVGALLAAQEVGQGRDGVAQAKVEAALHQLGVGRDGHRGRADVHHRAAAHAGAVAAAEGGLVEHVTGGLDRGVGGRGVFGVGGGLGEEARGAAVAGPAVAALAPPGDGVDPVLEAAVLALVPDQVVRRVLDRAPHPVRGEGVVGQRHAQRGALVVGRGADGEAAQVGLGQHAFGRRPQLRGEGAQGVLDRADAQLDVGLAERVVAGGRAAGEQVVGGQPRGAVAQRRLQAVPARHQGQSDDEGTRHQDGALGDDGVHRARAGALAGERGGRVIGPHHGARHALPTAPRAVDAGPGDGRLGVDAQVEPQAGERGGEQDRVGRQQADEQWGAQRGDPNAAIVEDGRLIAAAAGRAASRAAGRGRGPARCPPG